MFLTVLHFTLVRATWLNRKVICKNGTHSMLLSLQNMRHEFDDVIEGITFHAETDDTTGLTEKIITILRIVQRFPL